MTIAEIAQRAGVSKTAVSRYLNSGYISQEKKERIRAVIEETGYTPSRQAQNLRRGTSRTIGVILPRIDSESISRIVAGISQVLEEKGFQLLLANTENNIEREIDYLEYFKNDQVDGILFIATIMTRKHREAIAGSRVPVVIIGQKADYVSCVYHDDYAAARELTELLIRGGRRRIGMLSVTQKDLAAGAARYRGYVEALQANGIHEGAERVQQTDFDIEAGYESCRQLMDDYPDTDAILCATDSVAVGAMKYLHEQGKRVPEDVAMAGVGHNRLSEIITPRLTTAHYYYRTSGIEAAKVLLQILDSELDMHKQIQLGYQIIEQETTDCVDDANSAY